MLFSRLHSLSLLVLPISQVAADSHAQKRVHGHAARNIGVLNALQSTNSFGKEHYLGKRFDDARFTFYNAGLGACGKVNKDSDFVVALNSIQFASGKHCFETITITYKGKSTHAQIVDECPGCPNNGLDFSRALFKFFENEDAGVIKGAWSFGGGLHNPKPPPKKEQPKPKPSPKPLPVPSKSTQRKASSSSNVPKPSSSTKSTNLTSSATKTHEMIPSASTLPESGRGALNQLNQAIIGMGGLIHAGHGAQ